MTVSDRRRMVPTPPKRKPRARPNTAGPGARRLVSIPVTPRVMTIPTTVKLVTRTSVGIPWNGTPKVAWYSAGQLNTVSPTFTEGVAQFDGKAAKFFEIYRYWRVVDVIARITNLAGDGVSCVIYAGWQGGSDVPVSSAALLDNEVAMTVTKGEGNGVLHVDRTHLAGDGIWRKTTKQFVTNPAVSGGVATVDPTYDEVTLGSISVFASTSATGGDVGLMTLESTWEFRELQ